MKVFRILILLISFSIIHLNKIYAQKDYVIKKNNDTVYCKIRTNGFNGRVQYRVNKKDKFSDIDTNLTEYFIANDTAIFILKKIQNEKYSNFIHLLERGKINLYERMVIAGAYATVEYLYASKGDVALSLIEAPGPRFLHADNIPTRDEQKKAFLNLFEDDPALQKQLQEDIKHHYSPDDINEYIKQYNFKYWNDNNSGK